MIEIVDQIDRFTELRLPWNRLLRASAADCPFLTWEWAYSWWTHLHESALLKILVVWHKEEPIAIAPLLVSRRSVPWFSTLTFLGTGFAGSDYLDVIVRPDFEDAALQALAGAIERQRLTVRMTHLPAFSLAAGLAQRLTGSGWTSVSASAGLCPFIQLSGHSWDSYLATLGASHRANYRRRLRALERDFRMRFEPVTTDSTRASALAALAAFHQQRWEARGSTAFGTPALRAFHDDVTRRMHETGWLRLYVLYLNDRVAATMYGFAYSNRFYFYQHGFDDIYQRHSVGLVLMGLTIQRALDEGAIEFDMLYGDEGYKSLWAQGERPLRRLDLFPPHFGGRIHRRRIEAEATMRALARRVVPRDAHVR